MGVLTLYGAESGAAPVVAANHPAEAGNAGAGSVQGLGTAGTIQTTTPRSGARCWRAASNLASQLRFNIGTHVDGRSYWMGTAFRIQTASPSAAVNILANADAAIRINTSRQLELRALSTTVATSSALSLNVWYYIELGFNMVAAGNDTIEGWLDGISWGSQSGSSYTSTLGSNMDFGPSAAYGATVIMEFDDIYVTDDQGSAPVNTRLDQPKLVSSFPVGDISRTDWTDYDNTTTNLYQSLDNTPPVPVAPLSSAQTADIGIKDSVSSTTANYVCEVSSANEVGIDNDDSILATALICTHGLDSATGTTVTSQQILPNNGHPDTGESNWDANAASGTWPTGWICGRSLTQAPTITDRSVRPQVEIGKRTAITRIPAVGQARIDWLYKPVTAAPGPAMALPMSRSTLARARR